jgi:hypothetical protein
MNCKLGFNLTLSGLDEIIAINRNVAEELPKLKISI